MKAAVKDYYFVHGTLEGIEKEFPYIPLSVIAEVQDLINKAKPKLPLKLYSDVDKLVLLYADYVLKNPTEVNFGGGNILVAADWVQLLRPGYWGNPKVILDQLAKIYTPDNLGVEFVMDEKEMGEPYVIGDTFYYPPGMKFPKHETLVKRAMDELTGNGRTAKVKHNTVAKLMFSYPFADKAFTDLVSLQSSLKTTVQEICKEFKIPFPNRLQILRETGLCLHLNINSEYEFYHKNAPEQAGVCGSVELLQEALLHNTLARYYR